MNNWKKIFERFFTAAAFAEVGEHKTALKMAGISPNTSKQFSWDKIFTAITFAEAGCPKIASEFFGYNEVPQNTRRIETFLEKVGLQGVHAYYGVAHI